jgi:hypothetical protein
MLCKSKPTPKSNGQKEIIKIRAEVNDCRPKNQNNKSIKNWLFEKISKINKPLPKLTKKRKEKT